MAKPRFLVAVPLCLVVALNSFACIRHDRRVQQHEEALQSLGSTVRTIAEAWLDGHLSGTYTQTALQKTFSLVEHERAALARPDTLVDPRGARLSDSADHLARLVAELISDVRSSDAAGVRSHLAALAAYRERAQQ